MDRKMTLQKHILKNVMNLDQIQRNPHYQTPDHIVSYDQLITIISKHLHV
jgi:hypothetical protein